jgi:YesN/AraC family two-component response regulator
MITDVVMPGFSGFDLAERLAAFRPETRVLYASGYSDDSNSHLHERGQTYAFLEKPFTREDLLDSPLGSAPCLAVSPDSTPLRPTPFQCG